MTLYAIGEYAYPALNFFVYSLGYAVIVFSTMGVYSIWKAWRP